MIDVFYRVSVTVCCHLYQFNHMHVVLFIDCYFQMIVVLNFIDNWQGFLALLPTTADIIVAGIVLSLAYLKAIQVLKPYTDPELNRIKETSIWQVFLVFFIALLMKQNEIDRDILTYWLLLVFFANFVYIIGVYALAYLQRRLLIHKVLNNVGISFQQSKLDEVDKDIELRCRSQSHSSGDSLSFGEGRSKDAFCTTGKSANTVKAFEDVELEPSLSPLHSNDDK